MEDYKGLKKEELIEALNIVFNNEDKKARNLRLNMIV